MIQTIAIVGWKDGECAVFQQRTYDNSLPGSYNIERDARYAAERFGYTGVITLFLED